MADFDVKTDRNLYVGGSDIGIIMGLSPFRTRYDLLLEKAGIAESDFTGNRFTEFGNVLEPEIRSHVNWVFGTNYEPDRRIKDDLRFHCDGYNGNSILEIKTTSQIHDTVDEYKLYLVQLIAYMDMWKVEHGILAVYERPEDFSLDFDPDRLQIIPINIKTYQDMLSEIKAEIDRFRADLARLKENPLLTEEDFIPNDLITLSNKVLAFEKQLSAYKDLEKQYEDMKQKLFDAMSKHNVKSWQTLGGVTISRVDAIEPTTEKVWRFDTDAFAEEHCKLYRKYLKETTQTKRGRKGYVRITLPKGEGDA